MVELVVDGYKAVETRPGCLEVCLPYGTRLHALPGTIETDGGMAEVRSMQRDSLAAEADSEAFVFDLSLPDTIVVSASDGRQVVYILSAHFSHLPVVYLSTPAPVTSRTEWTEGCTMTVCHAGAADAFYAGAEVRGRGNSTWSCPKKPYAVRLGKRASVLGMPEHRRWVLLANWFDPSNLRSELGFFLGRQTRLAYTPRTAFVELVVNGEFQGVYQLAEQIKIDPNRLDIPEESYLLETDQRASAAAGDVFFSVGHMTWPVVVKSPDTAVGEPEYEHIVSYMDGVDRALFGPDFCDAARGYAAWLDVDSFVEWYLVNEITKNNDAIFFASCFMHLAPGGKLTMGPLWDFDLAFGNTLSNGNDVPEGFWIKRATPWFSRLFEDPAFVARVKQRYAEIYAGRSQLFHELDRLAASLSPAVPGNNSVWNFYDGGADATRVLYAYDADVERLRDWLEIRFEWLRAEFGKM